MFEREYVTCFQHNYIRIMAKKKEGIKPRYQYQILSTRRLDGLLPVNLQTKDGENALYYEISSRQSISKYFLKEKLDSRWMERLSICLASALWSLEQYLLDERNLILHPDCIFQNMENDRVEFLYCPYYIEEEKPELEPFLSFLVENVDENDATASETVYDMYSKWESLKEDFTVELLLHMLGKRQEFLPAPLREDDNIRQSHENKENAGIEQSKLSLREENQVSGQKETSLRAHIEGSVSKRISASLFGKFKKGRPENYQASVAMEKWEYRPINGSEQELKDESVQDEGRETQIIERKMYGNGKENRRVISLTHLPLVFGAWEERVDVVLSDSSISKMHTRISQEGEEIYLEDLNSDNGTFKNGVRLKPYEKVEILEEDEIKLGKLSFTYR